MRPASLTADPVVVFEGRNKETCLRWEEAKAAHELGYDPGEVLCPTCHHNPKNAVFAQKCAFMRQFEGINREKGLFFASHKLTHHLIKDFLKKAKIWLLDEEPHGLIEIVSCPLDGLRTLRAVFPEDSATMRLAEAVLELGDELHKATNGKRGNRQGRIYARSVEFGPWAGKKTLAEWLNLDLTQLALIIRDEITQIPKNHRKIALFRKGVNLNALRWLQEVVGQGQAYLVARKDPNHPIELRRVVNPVPERWRGRLVVLDATAYPSVVERSLRRPGMQVLDVRVPVEVRTAWLKRSVSKTAIMRKEGRKVAIKALKEAIKSVKGEKVLVFCHQALKPEVEKAVAQDGREIVVTHHFGSESRGTDRFRDFGAVILLGLPVPAPGAFYDAALALGLSAEEWEVWLDLLARAEAWQEIHRVRPALVPNKEVVVISRWWPFKEWLGPAGEVIEPEEIKGALNLSTRVLEAWLGVFLFVWREIALLLGIGRREEIPPIEVRAEVWRCIREAFPKKTEQFIEKLNGIYQQEWGEIPLKSPGNPFTLPEHSSKVPGDKEGKGFPLLFIYSLKSSGNPFERELQGILRGSHPSLKGVEFRDRKWWPKLLARLRKSHPDLPIFEVQVHTPGGLQRTRGLGDIEAAQEFCKAIGLDVNDNAWRVLDA